jgi:predicted CXXCH cytochrome family protein
MMAAAIALTVILIAYSFSAAQPATSPSISILYPKHNALVGKKVNLVVDPATDWTAAPFLQVVVGNTEYPVIDTSAGRHAVQGLSLETGSNTITVRVLAVVPGPDQAKGNNREQEQAKDSAKKKYTQVLSRSITVFNREGSFATTPPQFTAQHFHSREQEGECSGCHRLEAEPKDLKPAKPEEMLCYACHREIPTGRHIHGPTAVWNCLSCHNTEIYPVKYQFISYNPWTVTKTTQSVEPAVFTLSSDVLFKPKSALFVSETSTLQLSKKDRKNKKKLEEFNRAKAAELALKREQQRELFKDFLEFIKLNPADKILVEAHVDSGHFPPAKGKAKGFKNDVQLTAARAKALVKLLKHYGVAGKNRVAAAGMGSTLPKAPNTSKEGRELNNRIEIVVYPPDVKIKNSMKLPVLKDRERVVVTMSYQRGAEVGKLAVTEHLPKGFLYMQGSGVFRGAIKNPQVKGSDLTWQLGNFGTNFQETLSFIVKKGKEVTAPLSPVVNLSFKIGQKDERLTFDPEKPFKPGLTVKETCEKCHMSLLAYPVKHGPAEAGHCTLCHDPHASKYPSWTRNQSWRLCTTCHAEKKTGVHLIAGFVHGVSHPTKKWPDPSRPGKRLTCVSCHSPHSSQTKELMAFDVRNKYESCRYCHAQK